MSSRARRDTFAGGPRGGLHAAASRARVALRIARRTSLRSLGRSALIASMVALPVAGLAAAGLVVMSTTPTSSESMEIALGHTQARVQMVSTPDRSLIQSPTDPYSWDVDRDSDGNLLHSTADGVIVQPATFLPAGTRILPILDGLSLTAKTKDGIAAFPATEGPVWDPSLAGHYDVVGGRAPRTADEVMATRTTLARLGVTLGGTVPLLVPTERTVTIVGLIDDQTQPDSRQAFFTESGLLSGESGSDRLQQIMFYLPDASLNWSQVQEANAQGATVLSRAIVENPPAPGTYKVEAQSNSFSGYLSLAAAIGGFAFFEVALLAGAAFMVGARQQQRALATVASVGANRSALFSIVTSNGLVLGLTGGLAGIGLGIAGGSLFMRLTDDGNATRYWGYHLSWPVMAAILGFAVLVGWISAIVPAVNASRVDVVPALRGSRKPAPAGRRKPTVGLILVISGIALSLIGGSGLIALTADTSFRQDDLLVGVVVALMIAGPLLAQLGLVLCSALLLRGAARLLGRLGIGARLASRDAARNTGRSVPALAATMTTVFTAVFAMTMIASTEATNVRFYNYSTMPGQVSVDLGYWDQSKNATVTYDKPADYVSVLQTTLDVDTVRVLQSVPDPIYSQSTTTGDEIVPVLDIPVQNRCPAVPDGTPTPIDDWRCRDFSGGSGRIWIGGAEDLALVLDRQPSAEAVHALGGGGAVSLYPQFVRDHKVNVAWAPIKRAVANDLSKLDPSRTESLSAVVDQPKHAIRFGVFISPETAEKLGVPHQSSLVLASLKTNPSDGGLDSTRQQLSALIGSPDGAYVQLEKGPQPKSGLFAWVLLGLSALVAIASSAVAIGLARFDGRQDDATLASIGSSPLVRRNFAFWQGLVLAGLGAFLGAAVGLLPAIAFNLPGAGSTFAAPWLQIGITVMGLPLLIAGGSWLLATRSKVQARRVTIG